MRRNYRLRVFIFGITLISGCQQSSPLKIGHSNNSPAAEYNAKLGIEYFRQNKLQLANEKLQKAIHQDPHSANAHHYYALLQEKMGDAREANVHFQRAFHLNKNHDSPDLYNNYGSFLCKQGEYRQAVRQFLQALKDPLYKTPEFAYTNAGICLQQAGYQSQSERYFRKALDKQPKFPLALYQMSKLNYTQGQMAKAQAFLYRYQEIARDTPETLLLCYRINKKLQETKAASQCANQLMSDFPDSPETQKLG